MNNEEIKDLVANNDNRIRLHDKIVEELQIAIPKITEDELSSQIKWSHEEFKSRITKYEEVISDLCAIQIFLSYWGIDSQCPNHCLALNRVAYNNHELRGSTSWIILRWYPVILLLYSGGVSSMAASKYKNLFRLINTKVYNPIHPVNSVSVIQAVVNIFSRFNDDPFEIVLASKNYPDPRGEYIFKTLQPKFEKLLYLENQYAPLFDSFDSLMALEYAHQQAGDDPESVKAPIGRFRFKEINNSAYMSLIDEANMTKNLWAPIKAGFFGGDYNRFKLISDKLTKRIEKLRWY